MAAVKVFISHNAADTVSGRRLGAQLKLVGADVWFDEWEIRAGDSIPGKVGDALDVFDVFVLLWSENAASSAWVQSELEVALTRKMNDRDIRLVPIRLDNAALPVLLRPLKYLSFDDGLASIVDDVMGFATDSDRVRAIQQVLDEAEVRVAYFYGYGPMAGCPKCGAGVDALEQWAETDHQRDDEYAGARCKECGWSDGGEV